MAKSKKAKKSKKPTKKKVEKPKLDAIAERLKGLVKPNSENALKSPKDFVFVRYFIVEEVTSRSYATNVNRNNVIGGRADIQETGHRSDIVLAVRPKEDPYLKVRELYFKGVSAVKAGDFIGAKIPKYQEKKHPLGLDSCVSPGRRFRSEYSDREFREQEEAIEITIHTIAGGILRRDRSVDYLKFVNEDR